MLNRMMRKSLPQSYALHAGRAAVLALALAMSGLSLPAGAQTVPALPQAKNVIRGPAIAADTDAAAARMLEQARQLSQTAYAQSGPARISGLQAALNTLLDIIDRYPETDIAVQLRGGASLAGLSIADLSTLIDGLSAVDPITAAQAEAMADAAERLARGDAGSADAMITGAIDRNPVDPDTVVLEAPSTPVRAEALLEGEEAIAACDRLAASPNDTTRTSTGVWQTVMDTEAAMAACRAGVAAAPDTARMTFQLGRAVYRNGQPAEAALLFGKAATKGHMTAQAQLGLMLIAGDGTDRDAARGFALVKSAADKADPFAFAMLGELTTHGIGTARDEAEGLRLYEQAAQAGSPIGMQRLGEALATRNGGPRDDADALDWLNKAVANGAPTAHYMIGVFNRDGRVVRKDATQALSHFRLAAMAGDARALYEVGAAYINGIGISADTREGVSWMRRAAQAGVTDSYYTLAYAHAFGRGAERNADEAARYMYLSLRARSETAFHQMTRNADQWPPDMRRALQQAMKDAGVYSSSVDGSFGPATLQAIATLSNG